MAGVEACAWTINALSAVCDTTGLDGTYQIDGLEAGNYALWFNPSDTAYWSEYWDDYDHIWYTNYPTPFLCDVRKLPCSRHR